MKHLIEGMRCYDCKMLLVVYDSRTIDCYQRGNGTHPRAKKCNKHMAGTQGWAGKRGEEQA